MPAWKSQVWARDRQDVNIDGHEKARKTPLLVITARREPLGLETCRQVGRTTKAGIQV